MNRSTKIDFDWGDGRHVFQLKVGQIRELEEKTDCGLFHLHALVSSGQCRTWWLHETIRLGLIGGGMEPLKALALVREYCENRPQRESLLPAKLILAAAEVGLDKEEKRGKAKADKKPAVNDSQGESSSGPPSTEPLPS